MRVGATGNVGTNVLTARLDTAPLAPGGAGPLRVREFHDGLRRPLARVAASSAMTIFTKIRCLDR
jgi:hypothetical protein